MTARHATQGGLCEEPHYCPACTLGTGPCMDLFLFGRCGLVACATRETP